MASNALANAAAAVSAGYIKTNTDRGVAPVGAGNAPVYPASERFQTSFSKDLAGPQVLHLRPPRHLCDLCVFQFGNSAV